MHADRWFGGVRPEEHEVLSLALPAALDLGCGPGRHAAALARRGIPVLAVDEAPSAVELARRRGVRAVRGSVFDPIPEAGSWGTVLLLDGNLGIGGDPVVLLRRVRELLRRGGRALVEVEAPGHGRREDIRVGARERWTEAFPWSWVGADELTTMGHGAGFRLRAMWERGGRWFARLDAA
jgi:SAM-dependent methyltransferase